MTDLSPDRAAQIRTNFEWQSVAAFKLGSAFYGCLFSQAATQIDRGQPLDRILARWAGIPASDLPALRWAGALHFLALSEQAPRLARHYPSCGGAPSWDEIWRDIDAVQGQFYEFMKCSVRP